MLKTLCRLLLCVIYGWSRFLASQICLITLFAKIKFSRKFPDLQYYFKKVIELECPGVESLYLFTPISRNRKQMHLHISAGVLQRTLPSKTEWSNQSRGLFQSKMWEHCLHVLRYFFCPWRDFDNHSYLET